MIRLEPCERCGKPLIIRSIWKPLEERNEISIEDDDGSLRKHVCKAYKTIGTEEKVCTPKSEGNL